MLCNLNTNISNTNFNGCYSCHVRDLTEESRKLLSEGVDVIKDAKTYLENIQQLNCGKYSLSNCEKPSKISPVLTSKVEGKDLQMTAYYNNGFNLMIKDGDDVDVVSLYGGDTVEFESSKHPLKYTEYKNLSGNILQRAEELLKKYLPIFIR